LAYLAHYVDTITIDSPCSRIPAATLSRSWAARVSKHPSVRFTAKLSQGFTDKVQGAAGVGEVSPLLSKYATPGPP
jgi:hypothetical protein